MRILYQRSRRQSSLYLICSEFLLGEGRKSQYKIEVYIGKPQLMAFPGQDDVYVLRLLPGKPLVPSVWGGGQIFAQIWKVFSYCHQPG